MHEPLRRLAGAALLSAALMAATLSGPSATAATPAGLLTALQHVPGLVGASASVPTSSDADSALVSSNADLAVDVPRDPARGVTVTASNGLPIKIGLAGSDRAADAALLAPGLAGFTSAATSTDLAVQVLPDGVRSIIAIYGGAAPTSFSFPLVLPAGALEHPDASYRLVDVTGEVLAVIDPPWALDAQRKRVAASYTLQGSTLVLNVPHAGATYPVIADPAVRAPGSVEDRGDANPVNGSGGGGSGGAALGCGRAMHEVDGTVCQGGSVNSRTGEFVATVADLARKGRGLSFAFTRAYRSGRTTGGPLGPGWTHSYNASLAVATNGNVTLDAEDGQTLVFTKQADGSFVGEPNGRSKLVKTSTGYTLTRRTRCVTCSTPAAGCSSCATATRTPSDWLTWQAATSTRSPTRSGGSSTSATTLTAC